MKRFICFILGLIFMIASMSGCQKGKNTNLDDCLAPHRVYDIETLFEDLAGAYYANVDDPQIETEEYLLTHGVGTKEKPFLVPIIHSDQYLFEHFSAGPELYVYSYRNVVPPENSVLPRDANIIISFDKDTSFSDLEDARYMIWHSSKIAQNEEDDIWFFDCVGGVLWVSFPDSIPIESPDKVWDYISVEQYVVDAEGVHKLPEIIDGDDYR